MGAALQCGAPLRHVTGAARVAAEGAASLDFWRGGGGAGPMSATETKSAQLAHELAPYRAYTRRVLDSLVCEILVMLLVLIYAVRDARAIAPATAAPYAAHRTPPSVPGHSPHPLRYRPPYGLRVVLSSPLALAGDHFRGPRGVGDEGARRRGRV